MTLILEVVGYKGVVGKATYEWLKVMKPSNAIVLGRDKEDAPTYDKCDSVISFLCVPEIIIQEICKEVAGYASLMVIRSTVKPNTCKTLQSQLGIHICHNPEFLREALAVQDMFNPNFILIGACCQEHGSVLKGIYKPASVNIVVTDTIISEMVKLAVNNYLACLISFWNEIEAIALASGVSGYKVGAIASLDPRVVTYGARYHHQFNGKCLPKDLRQMIEYGTSINVEIPLLKAIQEVNQSLESGLLEDLTRSTKVT